MLKDVGLLTNYQVKLHINHNVVPVHQKHRGVPFAVRDKVENEIQKLEAQGIIETPKDPTQWVSRVVSIPKSHNPKNILPSVDMLQIKQSNVSNTQCQPLIS